MKNTCAVLYYYLWSGYLYLVFPHYVMNVTIFGKKLLNIKCVLISLQLFSDIFDVLSKIHLNTIIKVQTSSCKVPIINARF